MDEKQWLGDLWGVSKETWFEIWVNSFPAALGGLIALGVALLVFRMERAKEKRRAWSEATFDFIELLGRIAQQGVNEGPQFDSAEFNRVAQQWAMTSPLPRKRASLLVGTILKWMAVWHYSAAGTNVQDRTFDVPYRKAEFMRANIDFHFSLLAALHTLEGASQIRMWTFYDRCYTGARDVLNMRFALAVKRERTGNPVLDVSMTLPPPGLWAPAVWLADRLDLYPNMFSESVMTNANPFRVATL